MHVFTVVCRPRVDHALIAFLMIIALHTNLKGSPEAFTEGVAARCWSSFRMWKALLNTNVETAAAP